MLGWRLAVSAVLIPAFVLLFFLDQRAGATAPILLAIVLAIAIRSAWELAELFRTRAFEPSFWQTALLSCVVAASPWYVRLFPASENGSSAGPNAPLLGMAAAILWLLAS